MKRKWLAVVLAATVFVALAGVLRGEKYKPSEWKKLKKDIETAVNDGNFIKTGELIAKAGEDESKRAVDFLVELGLKVSSPDVYSQVKRTLACMQDEKALAEIKKRLKKGRDVKTRIMLIEVLGEKADPAYLDDIASPLNEKNPDMSIVITSIHALAAVGGKGCMTRLVDYLERIEKHRKGDNLMGTDWYDCRAALKSICGGEADYETAAEWRQYIGSLPDNWEGSRGMGGLSDGKFTTTPVMPKKTPQLFGAEVVSRTPVFVIDISGSMVIKDPPPPGEEKKPDDPSTSPAGPGKKPRELGDDRMRIVRAKKELTKLIKALDKGVRFNIIAYNRKVKAWSRKGLKPATKPNKASAVKFVQQFKAEATTHTDEALKEAWENVKYGCDTIYLLSDGWPTHSGDNKDSDRIEKDILEFFRKNNKFKKVRIHTLGFRDAHFLFMRQLADENSGRFRDIK